MVSFPKPRGSTGNDRDTAIELNLKWQHTTEEKSASQRSPWNFGSLCLTFGHIMLQWFYRLLDASTSRTQNKSVKPVYPPVVLWLFCRRICSRYRWIWKKKNSDSFLYYCTGEICLTHPMMKAAVLMLKLPNSSLPAEERLPLQPGELIIWVSWQLGRRCQLLLIDTDWFQWLKLEQKERINSNKYCTFFNYNLSSAHIFDKVLNIKLKQILKNVFFTLDKN